MMPATNRVRIPCPDNLDTKYDGRIRNHDISHFSERWNPLVYLPPLLYPFRRMIAMKKTLITISNFLIFVLILSACNIGLPSTTESTQTTPKPEEATEQLELDTLTPILAATKPYQDLGYYDGIVVITQYYTFLGHNHYAEAYSLLSQHKPNLESLEEFIQNREVEKIEKIKIVTIQPYFVHTEGQGVRLKSPDSENEKRFYVQIIAWGEGRMVGGAVSGWPQTLFLTLVKEDGEWKIFSGGTAPTP